MPSTGSQKEVRHRSPQVLILDKVHAACRNELESAGFEVLQKDSILREDLEKRLGEVRALVLRGSTRLDKPLLEKAARHGALGLIVRVGAGVDNVDIEAATEAGIVVENTPGTNANAVIELTLAALLTMARNLIPAHLSVKGGRWEKKALEGWELSGKTLGIIGLGTIGRGVAKVARAFGMTVIGYDPLLTEDAGRQIGVELCPLDSLYARSDYITLHASLTRESRGMLDGEAFARMKRGVSIANCARAELVQKEALLEALDSGKVRYFFTDVFDREPPPADDPIVKHARTFVSPHVGGSTAESAREGARQAAAQVIAFLRDGEAVNAINLAPGDPALKPWELLAGALGRVAHRYWEGQKLKALVFGYHGKFGSRPDTYRGRVTSSFLQGFLCELSPHVNLVNAREFARRGGIKVTDLLIEEEEESLRVGLEFVVGQTFVSAEIAGTVLSNRLFLSELDGYRLDLPLAEHHLLISRHSDIPGIVGVIGTVLGESAVNIEKMALRDVPGRKALAVISTLAEVPEEVLEKISRGVQAKGGEITLVRVTLD